MNCSNFYKRCMGVGTDRRICCPLSTLCFKMQMENLETVGRQKKVWKGHAFVTSFEKEIIKKIQCIGLE